LVDSNCCNLDRLDFGVQGDKTMDAEIPMGRLGRLCSDCFSLCPHSSSISAVRHLSHLGLPCEDISMRHNNCLNRVCS